MQVENFSELMYLQTQTSDDSSNRLSFGDGSPGTVQTAERVKETEITM